MRRLMIAFLLASISLITFGHEITPETFRNHALQIAKHPKITKKFSMIDMEENFHLYMDVTSFDEFYVKEPIETQGFKLFLWKSGEMGFYNIEQYVTLITVLQTSADKVIYELVSQVDHKRFVIQVLFENQQDGWQLTAVKRTKIKTAKPSIFPKFK